MGETLNKPKIPLKTKFKVWWEGYDIHDVEARLRAAQPSEPAPPAKPKPAKAPPPPLNPTLPVEPWDSRRIEIAQYIWGEGYCGPGGPDHVIALSKLLALSPEMSALVIGAGLGGSCRVLAHEYGVWITGVEKSRELAAAGMELSIMAGLAKKALIKHYDPTHDDALERNFDRVFAKEALYTVADKKHLIRQVHEKLKVDSLFLLTDYFLATENATGNADFQAWKKREPEEPHVITATAMVELLTDVGFNVRVNEDMSDQYQSMIAHAWAEADKVVAKLVARGEEGRQLVDLLMHEAELWSSRSKMLANGHLQVHRMLAVKKAPRLK